MAVLVTGGCGLAGSFAVRHAVDQGEKVVSYDIALKTELLQDILDRVVLVKGDILDAPDLMRTVKEHRIDRILHTASFLTPGAYERPYAAVQTSVMGTLNVLECGRLFGLKRVVYISTGKTMFTAAAYGKSASTGELACDADPYTTGKVACELLCNDYRRMYDLDILIVRFGGQVFGPGYAFAGAAGQAFKDLVEKPLRGEQVKMGLAYAANSARVMPLLYAVDAGRGAMMATLADRTRDYVFNINGQESMTLWEVAGLLNELIPGADIQVPRGPEKGGPETLDPRAKEQFGYVPEYSVRRGFREYIAFLKTGRWQPVQ
jgi:nucleoside-diphosphate-sugar epimerase